MMIFMWRMYENKKANYLIISTAVLLFAGTLVMLRQQSLVDDIQWMKAMIPHHSSAILVSQEVDLKDPEAQELARQIIESQQREIAQMKEMITRLENQ